jgi:hypothetical protein
MNNSFDLRSLLKAELESSYWKESPVHQLKLDKSHFNKPDLSPELIKRLINFIPVQPNNINFDHFFREEAPAAPSGYLNLLQNFEPYDFKVGFAGIEATYI